MGLVERAGASDPVNALRTALAAGRVPVGGWATLDGTASAELLAASGLDWVLVDLQHGVLNVDRLPDVVRAVEIGGAQPVVRVPSHDAATIMRALDLGAVGVVVPLVNTSKDAAAAVSAMRYPPFGTRSFGPARPVGHASRSDSTPLCLPMIETAAGLAAVDEIAATDGVDGLFVGAVDLGLSLGLGHAGGPELDAAVDRVIEACMRHDITPVTVAADEPHARALVARGARMLTLVADRVVLGNAIADITGRLAMDPLEGAAPDPTQQHTEEQG